MRHDHLAAVDGGALEVRDDAHVHPAQQRLHPLAGRRGAPAGDCRLEADERGADVSDGRQAHRPHGGAANVGQRAGYLHQRDVIVQRARIVARMLDGPEAGLRDAAGPEVQAAEAQIKLPVRLRAVGSGEQPRAGNDGAAADAERSAAERRQHGALVRKLIGAGRLTVGDKRLCWVGELGGQLRIAIRCDRDVALGGLEWICDYHIVMCEWFRMGILRGALPASSLWRGHK